MAELFEKDVLAKREQSVKERIGAIGWGAFLIWMGIVFLANVPEGWALIVVGLITLGAQIARGAYGLTVERFWLVVGALFLLGGAWQLFEVQLSLVPVLLLVGGTAVILHSLWPGSWRRRHA